ncbi:MAG TPA: hypothetical protein VFB51_05125 [Solirubrobacterales bacterium]|nr:hypothetical protein [Solirubrobacterales bacterium]
MAQKVNINPMTEDHVSCEVCHRTMLKGERAEPYLTPSRERRLVCQLCAPRAQHEGWIREAAAPEMPARPARQPERRGILRRRRKRGDAEPEQAPQPDAEPERLRAPNGEAAEGEAEEAPLRNLIRRTRPRSPRQVKAVPTNAQLKIGRALELFNASEHPRTVAGLARTLGEPHAGAATSTASAAEVVLTVAWELSWYQFNVDLSDGREPVRLRGQGQELSELPGEAQNWNCEMAPDGTITLAAESDEQAAPPPVPETAGGGEDRPL